MLGNLVTTMNVKSDDPLTLNSPQLDDSQKDAVAQSRLAEHSANPRQDTSVGSGLAKKKTHSKRPSTSGIPSETTRLGSPTGEADPSGASRSVSVPPLLRFHST